MNTALHELAKALAVFAGALVMLLTADLAWAGSTESRRHLLEAGVDQLVRDSGISPTEPGLAVLITRPGQVLLMKSYGLADLGSGAAITRWTRFELASVSKIMTATAVLMLHERGQLSINDDVRKFIPELPHYQPEPLRISDMLHDVSGLHDYFDLKDVPQQNQSYWVSADYPAEFARQHREFPLRFPIGEKYEYSNSNYMLLSLVVERAAKKPFARFLHDEVFVPAGMLNTFVYDSPTSVSTAQTCPCNNALGYEFENGQWVESWGTAPARYEKNMEVGDGGIWSNLSDMANWDAAVRAHTLLKPDTMRLALTPSKTRDGKTNPYGLGWQLDLYKARYGFGHDGDWSGFKTLYYNYLTSDHTVVLLSNRGDRLDLRKFWEQLTPLIEAHAP